MAQDKIVVRGARTHNLQNVDVDIPRNKLVVVTGLSGSGKSSLAFDTIYAEGQRRYVESLSAYARQFLGQMDKPDVDYIEGLSPAISIDQKTTSRNPRSTVGTVTEIYDYLRLLYARAGEPYCPNCDTAISMQTIEQIVDQVLAMPEGTRFLVLAPVVRGQKGEHVKLLENLQQEGYVRVRVDGEMHELGEPIQLDKNRKHTIEVVVDRLIVRPHIGSRLADSIATATKLTDGLLIISTLDGEETVYNLNFACTNCGFSYSEISPRMFSFNNPYGACPHCDGLGAHQEFDRDLIIPKPELSLAEGAIAPWAESSSNYYPALLQAVCDNYKIDYHAPVADLTEEQMDIILHGGPHRLNVVYSDSRGRMREFRLIYRGVIPMLNRMYRETSSSWLRENLEQFMTENLCAVCNGQRLKPESLSVKVGGLNIAQVSALSIAQALEFFSNLELSQRQQMIARQILKEIKERLGFLVNVGLDYLTLDRQAGSLSGGEAQRIRLATQIGSSLMGVLYILDEPSIGLHQRDNSRLIDTLKSLRDLGNTVIVVEHDQETMEAADHIIDMGPGAGQHGGRVVATGTLEEISQVPESVTGQYFSGKRKIEVPSTRRQPNGKYLEVIGARENNLKNIDVKVPLGVFTCVTGVSGSGKSTLVNEIIHKRLAMELNRARRKPGAHDDILGLEHLEKVINIDQAPIGRTPRSNPATYTGAFDPIRQLFAETPMAKMRGYAPGRFSFNVKGGRCEACKGDGIVKIEMHFLPDVYVPCEVRHGKRYNRETLDVRYKDKTIADVLEMTIEEALEFFQSVPRIARKLQTLVDVGLGYMRLGQSATTLSGGEAQRVKLATELSRRSNGRTFYILDEPTTGLHMADIERLLEVLQRLVDAGDTVMVIEHNLDVIKSADYIIDLGPEGGDRGGQVVATGTPEEVAASPDSYTGYYLRQVLQQ
ncbi:MAG: excinuclease ABC subunit UvrA [Firmicutes bacterium]|nr:excinuclease ABC subunit UvrA [Bacillota bacterium]